MYVGTIPPLCIFFGFKYFLELSRTLQQEVLSRLVWVQCKLFCVEDWAKWLPEITSNQNYFDSKTEITLWNGKLHLGNTVSVFKRWNTMFAWIHWLFTNVTALNVLFQNQCKKMDILAFFSAVFLWLQVKWNLINF